MKILRTYPCPNDRRPFVYELYHKHADRCPSIQYLRDLHDCHANESGVSFHVEPRTVKEDKFLRDIIEDNKKETKRVLISYLTWLNWVDYYTRR